MSTATSHDSPDPILKDGDLVEFRRVRQQPKTSAAENPQATSQPHRTANPYAVALVSGVLCLTLGMSISTYALWTDPAQAQVRELQSQNQALASQLEAITRCLGGG